MSRPAETTLHWRTRSNGGQDLEKSILSKQGRIQKNETGLHPEEQTSK
jgi:hypothetical protein